MEDELIEQIRELRAYIRRSDEAIRTVAGMVDNGVDVAELKYWRRRAHVRVVAGDPKC